MKSPFFSKLIFSIFIGFLFLNSCGEKKNEAKLKKQKSNLVQKKEIPRPPKPLNKNLKFEVPKRPSPPPVPKPPALPKKKVERKAAPASIKESELYNPFKRDRNKKTRKDTLFRGRVSKKDFAPPPSQGPLKIKLEMGSPLTLPEGSTLILEQVKILGENLENLNFQWELLEGPKDKIKILKDRQLKAGIFINDIQQPTKFTLNLTVSRGSKRISGKINITALPLQLKFVVQEGGTFDRLISMGNKWVVQRGKSLQIYSQAQKSLARIPLDYEVRELFTFENPEGKGRIFVRDNKGIWRLLYHDIKKGVVQIELTHLGTDWNYRGEVRIQGKVLQSAWNQNKLEFWSFSNPWKPILVKTLKFPFQELTFLVSKDSYLYVTTPDFLYQIDKNNGFIRDQRPLTSPASGLEVFELQGQAYLVLSMGKGGEIRRYQINPQGQLGSVKEYRLENGARIERLQLIGHTGFAIAKVAQKNSSELFLIHLLDLQIRPLGIQMAKSDSKYDFAVQNQSGFTKLLMVDGNQWVIYQLDQDQWPVFSLKKEKRIMSVLNPQWVQTTKQASWLWVGDLDRDKGGSLILSQIDSLLPLQKKEFVTVFPLAPQRSQGLSSAWLNFQVYSSQQSSFDTFSAKFGWVDLNNNLDSLIKLVLSLKKFPLRNARAWSLHEIEVAEKQLMVIAISGIAKSNESSEMGGGLLLLRKSVTERWPDIFKQNSSQNNNEWVSVEKARDVALTPNGQGAFVAAGRAGIVSLNLVKKTKMRRMKVTEEGWLADRVKLKADKSLLFATFIHEKRKEAMLKIFKVDENLEMKELGTVGGLPLISSPLGFRSSRWDLSEDMAFLFLPLTGQKIGVFNLTNLLKPAKIAELTLPAPVLDLQIDFKQKNIFVAMGKGGIARISYDFVR